MCNWQSNLLIVIWFFFKCDSHFAKRNSYDINYDESFKSLFCYNKKRHFLKLYLYIYHQFETIKY